MSRPQHSIMADSKNISPGLTTPVHGTQYAPSEEATLALDPPSPLVGSPQVDLEHAATLKPSRLRGARLMLLITFIAGTGVSAKRACPIPGVYKQFTMFGYDQGVLSSLLTLDTFAETFPQAGGSFSTLQSFMVAVCEYGMNL